MVDRVYQRNASDSAPQPPSDPSTGYPTNGNPSQGVSATQPGEWWYHMITESLRKVITDAGLTPDHTNIGQLAEALGALAPAQNIAVFDAAGTTEWAVPQVLQDGHRKAHVIVVAGGGGGAFNEDNQNALGGAGAGGAAIGIVDLSSVDTVDITVGAGGASGDVSPSSGQPGESSSFGAYLSATGGDGVSDVSSGFGSEGGMGTGGNINIKGGNGHPKIVNNVSTGAYWGGQGGDSILGGGSRGGSSAVSIPGIGGGAGSKTSDASGVPDGGDGIVIVRW